MGPRDTLPDSDGPEEPSAVDGWHAASRAIRAALAEMTPEGVAFAVWGVDVTDHDPRDAEEAFVASAIERRRVEFHRGRACARAALRSLGGPTPAIPVGERREPVWPEGYVGAITHSHGVVAAVVGRSERLAGLGVDVERARELEEGVERLILTADERGVSDPAPWRSALLFSAKECVYKAVFPTLRRWIGFHEVEIDLDTETFRARYVGDGAPTAPTGPVASLPVDVALVGSLRGTWSRTENYVLTFAVIPGR